ncbi:MAG: 4-(cytidine 5'-diphospho)-2-C-methyl-D-erythritol kinase [Bacteroidales bacterium]|nr:4-(cytidine 5'-diphospho)-2-C-methyl-D-erythritol kinase [Bacteroidales bacterium]
MITDPNVKINLGLNILRKREDGYHDLETLFVPYFGISDRLEIVIGDDYSRTSAYLFNRYGTDGPESQIAVKPEGVFGTETEESGFDRLVQKMSEDGKVMITIARAEGVDWDPLKDLTVKAYRVLAEDFELPPVKIFLEKKSPVGAGLGGGSADAAFALKMINELCELGLSELSLATYASRLGSDCAFFIYNRPMFGEGRGEVLTEFTSDVIRFNAEGYAPAGLDIQVVSPEGISVSTKDAYGGIVPHIPEVPLREVLSGPIERWKELLVNDFEATVFAKHPELAAIKQSLYDSGAVYASMSGSGSSLFAVYEKE